MEGGTGGLENDMLPCKINLEVKANPRTGYKVFITTKPEDMASSAVSRGVVIDVLEYVLDMLISQEYLDMLHQQTEKEIKSDKQKRKQRKNKKSGDVKYTKKYPDYLRLVK